MFGNERMNRGLCSGPAEIANFTSRRPLSPPATIALCRVGSGFFPHERLQLVCHPHSTPPHHDRAIDRKAQWLGRFGLVIGASVLPKGRASFDYASDSSEAFRWMI